MRKILVSVAVSVITLSLMNGMEIRAKNHTLGGNVRGFGVLAEYAHGELREIEVERFTTVGVRTGLRDFPEESGRGEPLPDFCLLKVFDPSGRNVAICDLGGQKESRKTYKLSVPAGPAGIWRVSVLNGRNSDSFILNLPDTSVWGIRGEMALGLDSSLPQDMYLYLPEKVRTLIVECFGGGSAVPVLEYQGNELGRPKQQGRRCFAVMDNPPAGRTIQVKLEGCAGKAIVFDGVPGLLCPTPEAAEKLRGGTIMADGILTAGPLQARARKISARFKPSDFDVNLQFPATIPDSLSNPRRECLFFGKYALLNSFASASSAQICDPASPWFGANADPEKHDKLVDWQSGLHGSVLSPFDASALAAGAVLPGRLNPLHDNQAVIRRAQISAFYHLISLQGDDIMREGDFRKGNYPMTHAFFVYDGALSRPLALLKDKLDPEAREVWADGLAAIGDKLAGFTAYQSNQWSHVISAHLETYRATGKKRFLSYFEQLMTAYLDNTFGSDSKFGQHPAGFFLEEYGPDGNYDHLNMYSLVSCYHKYREEPDADKKLVDKMRRGIEKNLHFKSFYWLPQPDGNLICPNAMNCRTNALLCYPSYPGDYMSSPEFNLGYTRLMLTPVPEKGSYPANVFPHLAWNDEWALRLINEMLPKGDKAFKSNNFGGSWTADVYEAWSLPQKAVKQKLPIEYDHGLWELPGQIAWKEGALYGLVFYDVAGAKGGLNGITGGAPSVLWSKNTGSVFCSMRNTKSNRVEHVDDLTWACVHGNDGKGGLVWSGKERAVLRHGENTGTFVISSDFAKGGGSIDWQYSIANDKLTLCVTLKTPGLKDPVLSLPVLVGGQGTFLKGPENGKFHFIIKNGFMRLKYPDGLKAELTPELKTSNATVRCLKIPFPADGRLCVEIDVGTY